MSKIQIAELQEAKSELSLLRGSQFSAVVGGRDIRNNINVANIVQIQNAINININFGSGDITSVTNLIANAGINQGNSG